MQDNSINSIDELFVKWFNSFDDLFDDTQNRTREELLITCRKNAKEDMLLTEMVQLNLSNNEKFKNETRLIYKDLCENHEELVLFWTSYDITIARKKNTLKRLFKEWFRLNYSLKLFIGFWEKELIKAQKIRNQDEILGIEYTLNSAKRLNNHALKFINMLFEEYNLHNNKKFLNKDFKK